MTHLLHHGDCFEYIKGMADGSVDAVVSDPPYGVKVADWDHDVPYHILPEMLRVATGMVVWFGSSVRMAQDLRGFPVEPDRILIWHVGFSFASTAKNGIFYRYHPIYTWRLPEKQKAVHRDVITCTSEGAKNWWNHPGTKPLHLMQQLVRMVPADSTILDPFMGSGTTGVACAITGRNFIGCEIDNWYYEVSQRRIEEAERQPLLLALDPPEQADLFAE